MNKILVTFLIVAQAITLHGVVLRNGFNADQKRIDCVWKGLQKTNHYSLLLCTAMDCKNGTITDQANSWNVYSKIIAEWARFKIIKNGVLDTETQEIIVTSYFADRQPDWGTIEVSKRIALATPTYPVATWVEKIPGYSLLKDIQRIKAMRSTVVPMAVIPQ